MSKNFKNFQDFIMSLIQYWIDYDCIWSQSYDAFMGAGTFHPHTFLKGLGPEPWRTVSVQPCRRPLDGRYGKSPYRFQHFHQLQVILKPSPSNIVDLFLQSLEHVGIQLKEQDIGLYEDDWKGPTLGAWGLGWEVRANGQEITQFTYFQQLGGFDIDVVCGEIAYGLERLFMYLNGYKNALDMPYNDSFTYGDVFKQNEYECSHYNFHHADIKELLRRFDYSEKRANELCDKKLILPAYDFVLEASHMFNLLDSRGAVSTSQRADFIARVRDCAKICAKTYLELRQAQGYPLNNRVPLDPRKALMKRGEKQSSLPSISPKAFKEDKETSGQCDLVFEIGVEEMPASFQVSAKGDLEEKISSHLKALKDEYSKDISVIDSLDALSYEIHISVRRIAFIVKNLNNCFLKKDVEIWGPPENVARDGRGQLSQVGLDFCKKNNIPEDSLEFKKRGGKVSFLYANITQENGSLISKINTFFKESLYSLDVKIKMTWLPDELSPPFIRPVRWILALANDEVIPCELFGLESSCLSYGQRILFPEAIQIKHAKNYIKTLKEHSVLVEREERRTHILNAIKSHCDSRDARLVEDENILSEMLCQSEDPDVFLGQFDKKYLRLPENLIISVLKNHMTYFALKNKDGDLIPYYIGVMNYKCQGPLKVTQATQNVVNGRLDDGAFYYDEDLSQDLDVFLEKTKDLIFHEGLGSVYDKSKRLQDYMHAFLEVLKVNRDYKNLDLFKKIDRMDDTQLKEIALCASKYSKFDLKTGCVLEFPDEMQGIMGGILVKHHNICQNSSLSHFASDAIAEQYLPQNSESSLPQSFFGLVLSLSDKLDSLSLFIEKGYEAKGSKDPLGLRRLAISILRIMGAFGETRTLFISLNTAFRIVKSVLEKHHYTLSDEKFDKIKHFLYERLKQFYKANFHFNVFDTLSHDMMDASLYELYFKAKSIDKALQAQKTSPSPFSKVLGFSKRISHILKDEKTFEKLETEFLQEPEEESLYRVLETLKRDILSPKNIFKTWDESSSKIMANVDSHIKHISKLSEPLDAFFDSVLVNAEDLKLRNNRKALLSEVLSLTMQIADFSKLQVM